MMSIQFSTNCPIEARKRITASMGKYLEHAGKLIDYTCEQVAAGKCRVGDPLMYSGNAPVFFGDDSTDADVAAYDEQYRAFIRGLP